MSTAIPEKIDRYVIVKSLGKGGMGEVFLAYDPLCKRHVALKQMRPELARHTIIKERFLREAQVAAQLVHPCIIPIFSIDPNPEITFYTMPYVEGETLKAILKQSYIEEKEGEVRHPIGSSIPALLRIFLSVCEAIAYTHSKRIVHRDLKPDNIIVGKYGEVLLLDWGLADFIGNVEPSVEDTQMPDYKDLTRPGKVPGTLNYMAPERIRAEPSTPATDIYSLGVILYQLLTLRAPFQRSSVKQFRKSMHLETLIDPIQRAPYRDIPQHLADITKRCLEQIPDRRYESIDCLIAELKNFLEGKPEWIAATELKVDAPQDWEFQENVLLSKHMAITRAPEVMKWVGLMISRASFSGNIKIEATIKMAPSSEGIGLLLGVPDASESTTFDAGYCIWLQKHCHLFQDNVEVMIVEDIAINDGHSHLICIEKRENHLSIYIDNKKICHYMSHTPLAGTHIGIVCQDDAFEIQPLQVMLGSQNALVGCLAIPDAFLANKDYDKAFLEYQKIAHCFSGRFEGRQALFGMGLTLVEQAAGCTRKKEREKLYSSALTIFSDLRGTPAAPLEYLGKALVYKATGEIEEEMKCLELCLRKYPKHPLLKAVREHIGFRLHDTSAKNRIAAYNLVFLCLRHLPSLFDSPDHARLLNSLKKHLEPLPFFSECLTCQLGLWLGKTMALSEMHSLGAMYALLLLGHFKEVEEKKEETQLIDIALLYFQQSPKKALETLCAELSEPTNAKMHLAQLFFKRALLEGKSGEILPFFPQFPRTRELDALHAAACLEQNALEEVKEIFNTYSSQELNDEYSPLFVPYGCYLAKTESKAAALRHFLSAIDLAHPPTTMLLSQHLRHRDQVMMPWEELCLLEQLRLFYHCTHNTPLEKKYAKQLQKKLKTI